MAIHKMIVTRLVRVVKKTQLFINPKRNIAPNPHSVNLDCPASEMKIMHKRLTTH